MSASLRDRLASDRNRELGNLGLLALLAAAGFTSVLVARSGEVSRLSITYAGAFIALFVAAHAVMRICAPNADSAVLPIVGVLSMAGLVEIQRIDPELARDQALWLALGVLGFAVVLLGSARLPGARAIPLPARPDRDRPAARDRPLLVCVRRGRQRCPALDPGRRRAGAAGRVRKARPDPVPGLVPARAARVARGHAPGPLGSDCPPPATSPRCS